MKCIYLKNYGQEKSRSEEGRESVWGGGAVGVKHTHKNNKTVNALREVQAVNVHNIPRYIHVIPECTPSDAVSNLCDRFR